MTPWQTIILAFIGAAVAIVAIPCAYYAWRVWCQRKNWQAYFDAAKSGADVGSLVPPLSEFDAEDAADAYAEQRGPWRPELPENALQPKRTPERSYMDWRS